MTTPIIVFIILALGVAVAFYLLRKSSDKSGGGWSQQYGKVTVSPDGKFTFGEPHYVVRLAPKLQQGQTVTLRFRLDGAGTLVPIEGGTPYCTLYFQRFGDPMSAVGPYQQYRYFGKRVVLGASGEYQLSATLTPEEWSDVYGASGSQFPTQFAEAVANAVVVGFVFGSSAGAGHGVVANGPVSFTLLEWSIK